MIIIQQKTKQAKQTNKKKTYLPIMAHLSNQI